MTSIPQPSTAQDTTSIGRRMKLYRWWFNDRDGLIGTPDGQIPLNGFEPSLAVCLIYRNQDMQCEPGE